MREEGVYAALHEAADALLLREDVDGDDEAEEGVHNRGDHRAAHVRHGADHRGAGAYHRGTGAGRRLLDVGGALLEVGGEVGEDLIPVHGEIFERVYGDAEAGEKVLEPLHDGVYIVRQLGGDLRHRGGELGQYDGDEDDDDAQGHDQRADQRDRAAHFPHIGAPVLGHAVEDPVFKELERHVEHKGHGEAGYHNAEDVPHRRHRAVYRRKVLRSGIEHHGEGDDEQYYADVFAVKLHASPPPRLIVTIIHTNQPRSNPFLLRQSPGRLGPGQVCQAMPSRALRSMASKPGSQTISASDIQPLIWSS